MPVSKQISRLVEKAVHSPSVEEREAALRQLFEKQLSEEEEAAPEFFQSFADPDNPVCYVCGRNEFEMSEWAAWQGTYMQLLPVEERRQLCCDCRDEPRQCTQCGEIAEIKFSGGNFEFCRDCNYASF